jgi:DNA-binding transcriptional LysR family regulator
MMDLVHLKSFAEVAERGTVAAAAAAQGYTAPAVSQHIAKLERDLGVALFDRVGGRLVITEAGAALAPIAFEMLDLDARGRGLRHRAG